MADLPELSDRDKKILHLYHTRPRWMAWIYALLHGYSWKPCPICHRFFGGQETMSAADLMLSWNTGTTACPGCWQEAWRRSQAFMASIPPPVVYIDENGNRIY